MSARPANAEFDALTAGEAILALTPAGALHAFGRPEPDATRLLLQSVLASTELPAAAQWAARSEAHAAALELGRRQGWFELLPKPVPAPEVRLDDFLPRVIAGLSGERKAALASAGGFCIGYAGYEATEAETLCAAAADLAAYTRRQLGRGWAAISGMVSFHDDITMLVPTVSFVPFWVDGTDYCLVLGGEPLTNNAALVELVWAIEATGARFGRRFEDSQAGTSALDGLTASPR